MSDFLTRLAGRALRQIPVLEPLAPSWTTPLAVAPETEEVEAQVQHGVWPAAVAMPQDAAAVEAPPLPDWPPMRSTLNLGLPGRVTTGLVEVEAVVPAPPQVVAAPAPAVAQHRAVEPRPAVTPPPATRPALPQPAMPRRQMKEQEQLEALREPTTPTQPHAAGATAPRLRARSAAVSVPSGRAVTPTAAATPVSPATSAPQPLAMDSATTVLTDRPARPDDGTPTQSIVSVGQHDEATLAEPAARRRRVEAETPQQPTISVSIGRIVVRAAPPAPRTASPAAMPPKDPRVSLDTYLAERSGSRR